jgi:hypothetical protein
VPEEFICYFSIEVMRHLSLCTSGRNLLLGALFFLLSAAHPHPMEAAGVTIITHGFELDTSYPTWVTAMADAIPNYMQARFPGLDNTCSTYKLTISAPNGDYSYSPPTRTNGSPPTATASGEIIIELDWSAVSGDVEDDYAGTSNVADFVAQILMATNSFPELNGRPAIEFPIHLVGHSRGGSLMAQLSYDLGTNGIWTDHLTTLDPYPINNDGNFDAPATVVDAPAQYTYSTVLYADNFWQDLGGGIYEGDPDGEAVAGAYVRQLEDLSGGYENVSSVDAPYHSNVHLWYHGTVDLATPASDTVATITSVERAAWWVSEEEKGTNAGFAYSLIGGGNRMSTNQPNGPGTLAIVDGYNRRWDFGVTGASNRTALSSNNGTWPNLIQFNVTGTNIVATGNLIDTSLYYQYAGASNVTLSIYFDTDLNPYNTNSTLVLQEQVPSTGAGSVNHFSNLALATTNVPPGIYAIYGKISDGTHTRYLYAPESVEIVSSAQPPVLGISEGSGTQWVIGVSGLSGQTMVLESSPDLHNWLPLATNTLTSGSWTYTNDAPHNLSQQFYRALVLP